MIWRLPISGLQGGGRIALVPAESAGCVDPGVPAVNATLR